MITLAKFQRGETDELIIAMRDYEGRSYLDIRIHYRAADGQMRPTKKGVTVRVNELHNFGDAIEKAVEIAVAEKYR